MKKLAALLLAVVVLSPAIAFAGSSTDAALGLGAFAVFNQILSGTGIFGWYFPAASVVVVQPPPPRVVVREYYQVPVYYSPAPVYRYPAPAYYVPARVKVVRGWCPPGHVKHGRC